MLRYLSLTLLLAATSSLFAQTDPFVRLQEIINDPDWRARFVRDLAALPDTEPKPDTDTVKFFKEQLQPLIEAQDFMTMRLTIEDYLSSLAADKKPALLHYTLGQLYLQDAQDLSGSAQQNAQRQARQNFEAAIAKFPRYLNAHRNLAQLLTQMGELNAAAKHFIKAVEFGDNDPRTFGVLGYIYTENEDFVSAESALRRALILNPDREEFRTLLGQALLAQERYAEAASFFRELIKKNPDKAQFWKAEANALLALDKIDQAAVNLEIIDRMGEADAQTLKLLGDIYVNRQMLSLAKDAFMRSLRADPSQRLDGPLQAANTLTNFGSYDDALELLNLIDQLMSNRLSEEQEIEVLTLRSKVNIARGDTEQGAANLEDILDRDPLNGEALLTLARYYSENAESIPRAIILYERGEEHPDLGVRHRAYLRHGQLMVRLRRWSEAVEKLENAVDLVPDGPAQENTIRNLEQYLDQVRGAARAIRTRS